LIASFDRGRGDQAAGHCRAEFDGPPGEAQQIAGKREFERACGLSDHDPVADGEVGDQIALPRACPVDEGVLAFAAGELVDTLSTADDVTCATADDDVVVVPAPNLLREQAG
jgi:hypothetical protein